jgi:TadE-like protein
MRDLRGESGQASIEFVGILMWLLLAGVLIWQLLLVTWSFTQASNAARTASRVDARGGDPVKAGRNALNPGLRKHAKVEMAGEKATVRVRIPIILPGLDTDELRATRSAELPG